MIKYGDAERAFAAAALRLQDCSYVLEKDENVRLKKPLADAMLDNAMLKEVASKMVRPVARREPVAHLRGQCEVSERLAFCVRLRFSGA